MSTTLSGMKSELPMLKKVIWYVAISLGIPGNILSMIVWMRHQVVSKNSSAVYLTTLAINDLIFLLLGLLRNIFYICPDDDVHVTIGWRCDVLMYGLFVNTFLEPLLVLAFSVERLIAILNPLKVCCMSTISHINVFLGRLLYFCTIRVAIIC